ncbi:MAG: sensor histidine kinase [Epulopiscium sp.]|nr:sensor histidine kinase [Candidatus Epulonipiscium sp.]
MLIELLQDLLNKLSVVVFFAFFLSKSSLFQRYILKKNINLGDKIFFSIGFGCVGILATYWAVPIEDSLANSRSISIVLAGILGGPLVGTGAGLIAGIHRMLIPEGRFTAIACGISTILAGLIGGLSKKYIDEKQKKWLYGLFIGMIVECLQMIIILIISKPFDQALHVVKILFFPMTVINVLGITIFLMIIQQFYGEQEKAGSEKAQLALNIANQTLPYLRKGLTEESAINTAHIIYSMTDASAVAITDTNKILVHVGLGDDHHKKNDPIDIKITRDVLNRGLFMVAQEKCEINCSNEDCPLKAVIVVPLKMQDHIVGSIKIYKDSVNSISLSDIELAKGLGHLFSTQLELSQIDYQKELLIESEIKALQAQIQPHFLFNALNTIAVFCRTNPNKARELILDLSSYLRNSFKNQGEFIPLSKEIESVQSYLSIEQARFSERLNVVYDIEPNLNIHIPPLILQPLVENAIKHGLLSNIEGGTVKISAFREDDEAVIIVEDTGVGMSESQIYSLINNKYKNKGVGLTNVNNRLQCIYGRKLEIESEIGKGTKITIRIPIKRGEMIEDNIS